ncbi:MAG TPA: dihydrodipicolinate reductase C-terminal domain-containing protein [Thermoanaerobaculia bacterium]|nr:dihydrodipicolinate reductase C-terminal domain-containing protein [Thermoanaerobaculia bacterium]
MKALIVGPGKMGREIEAVLLRRGHGVRARYGRRDDLESLEPDVLDVAFEFTAPESAPGTVATLLMHRVAVVSGTTGWDVEPARRLAEERKVPFLHSPSFSIGVAALRRAAMVLGGALARFPEFEPAIVERHHSAKRDAPSGTAKAISEAVGVGRSAGEEIPIVSLRHGGQPGEHVLVFEGPDESIELVHRARSRSVFALGAVRAAEWLVKSGLTGPVTFDDFLDRRTR